MSRSLYTILSPDFEAVSSMYVVLWSWEIAGLSREPTYFLSGRHAQTCLFVKDPRTLLSLLLDQTQVTCSQSDTCYVPLLWDRSLSLSGRCLLVLALSGEDPGDSFGWLLIVSQRLRVCKGVDWRTACYHAMYGTQS